MWTPEHHFSAFLDAYRGPTRIHPDTTDTGYSGGGGVGVWFVGGGLGDFTQQNGKLFSR